MKSEIRMTPSHASTMRAFFASGGLKAGTPSETASTPVSAAQPEAKARSTRNRVRSWVGAMTARAACAAASQPKAQRITPYTMSTTNPAMNR